MSPYRHNRRMVEDEAPEPKRAPSVYVVLMVLVGLANIGTAALYIVSLLTVEGRVAMIIMKLVALTVCTIAMSVGALMFYRRRRQ